MFSISNGVYLYMSFFIDPHRCLNNETEYHFTTQIPGILQSAIDYLMS